MIPITIRQLQYYVAVYEEASFTKASEREHSSQPALSAQIRKLEQILNHTLFRRSVTGVTATAEGQRFYRHAVTILRSINSAQLEMAEVSGLVAGRVYAGLIPSVVRGLLKSFLPKFVDAFPMIEVRILQGFSDILAQSVLERSAEFAIVLEPPKHDGIEITKFFEDRMALISNPALGLVRGEPVRLQELPLLNLVLPSPNHTLRRSIERCIWTREIRVGRILEMDTVHGMIDFVSNANWATILPMIAVAGDLQSERLCINPIVLSHLEADLYLIHLTRDPLSAAAQAFVEELRKHLKAIAASAAPAA